MSHWDPDLQRWVDPSTDRQRSEQARAVGEPVWDLPTGPSHTSLVAGAVAGLLLAVGLGVGLWLLLGGNDSGTSSPGTELPGYSTPAYPTPGYPTFGYPAPAYPTFGYPTFSYPTFG
ncbi:hypothetical protein GCM10010218_31700 [Streptomyces mashuensis]|uniref:Uncharacterized protein n=1 Tax=Streptomyces mashuensis TaxID=33904 RepID=A0A919EDT1_9ACTN|nr:hypothetical protein [Streptomyces mashuensis]GHF47921.1 hypothetical protein GCM10010218_31700 [Streptomyces mashuensis]